MPRDWVIKTSEQSYVENVWVEEYSRAECGKPQEGMEACAPSPIPCPMQLFHWLFLNCILSNKLVLASKVFAGVLAVLAIFSNLKVGNGHPICS